MKSCIKHAVAFAHGRRYDRHQGLTASSKQEATTALSAALDADRKAVEQMEKALAALPEKG